MYTNKVKGAHSSESVISSVDVSLMTILVKFLKVLATIFAPTVSNV